MTGMRSDKWIYLRSCLAPLLPALARADVTDIYVNRLGEIWLEMIGGASERQEIVELDDAMLMRLARQVASYNNQGISSEHPLLSASLPDGSRVQIIAPPATRGSLALAIGKHVSADLTLEDYDVSGSFEDVRTGHSASRSVVKTVGRLIAEGNIQEALRQAVRGRLTSSFQAGHRQARPRS